jgi:hypothetical protein
MGDLGGGGTQPLDSKQTLNHFLSTLSNFILSDQTGAADRRCGGVEWLSVSTPSRSGGNATDRSRCDTEARRVEVAEMRRRDRSESQRVKVAET